MFKIVSIVITLIAFHGCSSTRKASYYHTKKKIEHGIIDFHHHLRVDEYINAFPQENLPMPRAGAPIKLSVTPMAKSGDKNFVQVALRSRSANSRELDQKLGLSIVVDTSGSMDADFKMKHTLSALSSIVMELPTGTEIAIVAFDDHAREIISPVKVSSLNRRDLVEKINVMTTGGGTNIQDGLVAGYQRLAQFSTAVLSKLIIITDGQSSVAYSTPQSIAKKAGVAVVKGAAISTIGIGVDVDEDTLRKVAKEGGGHYYFADNSGTLTKFLREDLKSFMTPVASKAMLSISGGSNTIIKRIYGHQGPDSIDNKTLLDLGDVNVDDWRVFIAEIENSDERAIDLNATLEYEGGKKIVGELSNSLLMHQIDPIVARNSVVFSNALALIEASKLYEAGDKNAALGIIDLQLKNIRVSQLILFDKHLIGEEVTLLKVRNIIEGKNNQSIDMERDLKNQYEAMVAKPGNEKEKMIKSTLGDVIDIVKQVVPGPWTLLASLFYKAFIK